MAKKTNSVWEGMRFPARLLMEEEIDILSPRCTKCGLQACVVELQQPLTKELEERSIIKLATDTTQFYCAHHAPIDVPAAVEAEADLVFYESVKKRVHCPKQQFLRYASNCLVHTPNCLKRCTPVLKLLGGISPASAKNIIKAAQALEKEKRKEAANGSEA